MSQQPLTKLCPESGILNQVLSYVDENILGLDCGKVKLARIIDTEDKNRNIITIKVEKFVKSK